MDRLAKQITIKYAFLQGTYWLSQCAIGGFTVVFLQAKHFNNTQIGIVLSLASIFSIILQLQVSAFADKTKKVSVRQIVIMLMFLVLASAVILYIVPDTFFLVGGLYILITAIQLTVVPLFNSLAVEHMNQGIAMNYGLARGMGSVSFAITSFLLGNYVSHYGPGVLLPFFIITYCTVIISAFAYKANIVKTPKSLDNLDDKVVINKGIDNEDSDTNIEEVAPTGILTFFIKYKKFTLHLVGIIMLFYSHSLITTFLMNIIDNVGGNSADLGLSLSIAAILELPTMAAFIFLVKKIKCHTLLKTSAFFFMVKIGIAWLAPNIYTVHISQSFQMFAYALYAPASVFYVNSIIEEQDKVKGQTMLGVAMCIAGTIANVTGGKILDTLGVSDMLFLGTIVTALGFLIVCISTEKKEITIF